MIFFVSYLLVHCTFVLNAAEAVTVRPWPTEKMHLQTV